MEEAEKRISELEDTSRNDTMWKTDRKETERKMNRTSKTSGTITECLIFMSPEFWNSSENSSGNVGWRWKSTQRGNGWKLAKFGKKHKLTDSSSWESPHRINPKKFTPRHIIAKLLKAKEKEKKLKTVRKKWYLTIKEKNKKTKTKTTNRFLIKNKTKQRPEGSGTAFSKCWNNC